MAQRSAASRSMIEGDTCMACLAVMLSMALVACGGDPAAAPPDPAEPDDPRPVQTSGDPTDAAEPAGSSGADHPSDPNGSSSGSSGAPEPDATSTGVAEPLDCSFDPGALAVDCAAIARIVPTGIGVSEAHVARRHLRLEDGSGVVLGPEFQACLTVLDTRCEPAPVTMEPAPGRAITALLVRPDPDKKANAALVAALASFIDARPEGELVGVFRWGAEVTQVATPTADRSRLHRLVASGLARLDGETAPIDAALAAVVDPLRELQHDSHPGLRQLLVVAPGHPPLAPDGSTAPLRVELVADAEVEPALLAASARLDATLAAGELLIRQCVLDGLVGLSIHTAQGGPAFPLADVHIEGVDAIVGLHACDPVDQGVTPALPGVIAIEFSPTELDEYQARVADDSKETFHGSVRTDLNAPGVRAAAKFRLHGQGSLDCDRKSISLNFKDDRPRQLLADSGLDRFILISMCKDDRYLSQYTANLLMAAQGLLTPRFRMVELVIAGESQGAYLLIEKPQTALVRDNIRPRVIVRRRSDIEGDEAELKYAAGDEAPALAAYDALIAEAEALAGGELLDWIEEAMDLDQYLRWIALMSLLQSGDYIDEVYFMSTEVTGPDAGARDYFSISTWDQDDIFKTCHNGDLFALLDPHGLLYCAEGRLEHALLGEPEVYARFAEVLEQTLERIDQATFDAATHAAEASVLAILARDEARAAMVELLDDEPKAIDYEVAEAEVLARGAKLRQLFAERRKLIAGLLAAYDGPDP